MLLEAIGTPYVIRWSVQLEGPTAGGPYDKWRYQSFIDRQNDMIRLAGIRLSLKLLWTSCGPYQPKERTNSEARSPLRSPMSRDINPEEHRREAQQPDSPHRYDPVEALLRLKSLEQHGIEGPHLDPFLMDRLDRVIEVDPFAIPHHHIPRSDHEKEEGAQGHRCEVSSVSHTHGVDKGPVKGPMATILRSGPQRT